MRNTVLGFALASFLGGSGPAFAQVPSPGGVPGHQGMQHGAVSRAAPAAGPGGASASQQEMMASMERMNRDMMGVPMTGDPDRDFVAMMTPHHQGAIDMARLYLRDSKDPAIRNMAQRIIADQEREIREFRAWQAKHPAPG